LGVGRRGGGGRKGGGKRGGGRNVRRVEDRDIGY